MNRLGAATSPYLQQHKDNPVDWWQWGDGAFSEAKRRDVPILLSVGYAACHWCHVMAHESFENKMIAAIMNDEYVCIKVDREEHPDVDAIYMNATVAMTGQGGWPMTCFLTPDGDPFYCGTYYPPTPRPGMHSFPELLRAVADTWRDRRDEVFDVGRKLRDHLSANASALPDAGLAIDAQLLDHAAAQIVANEDTANGGLGGAPKFPAAMALEALLRDHERTGDPATLQTVQRATEAMARGGIYDQLAGGFARYSVDAAWVVPHFEKMLYDNALLLRLYAHVARVSDDVLALRITEELVEFLQTDLRTPYGFAASLDADTEGVEGLTYAWTPGELTDVLGADDAAWAARLFAVTDDGTFEHGRSTLQLLSDPDDADRYSQVRRRLADARAQRPQPGRDDKIVTAWNALTITALAEAGAGLGRPEWISLADKVARDIVDRQVVGGRVRRASLGGVVGEPGGVLEDYAGLVVAMLTLHQATGSASWLDEAITLLDTMIELFADPEAPGTWFDVTAETSLIARPRDPVDNATPSGAALMAEALQLATCLAAEPARYAELSAHTLARGAVLAAKVPQSAGHWLAVMEAQLRGPLQVAVAEADGSEHELLQQVRAVAPGGTVIVGGPADSTPLLADRPPVNGVDAVYVCRGTTCDLPVTRIDRVG
nr:thioredoxin domain-containing protein [Jongsikchunia kroppenstedtii]